MPMVVVPKSIIFIKHLFGAHVTHLLTHSFIIRLHGTCFPELASAKGSGHKVKRHILYPQRVYHLVRNSDNQTNNYPER